MFTPKHKRRETAYQIARRLNGSHKGKTETRTFTVRGYARATVTYKIKEFYVDGRLNVVADILVISVRQPSKPTKHRLPVADHSYGVLPRQLGIK